MPSPKTEIRNELPRLNPADFKVTSPKTTDYNCICWAAGENDRWWWPDPNFYWPDGFPLNDTIENFMAVFAALAYVECDSTKLEEGFQKVALYGANGRATHMARQLDSGRWTSKLGPLYDIEHKTLTGLEGNAYGSVLKILKRPLQQGGI